MKKFLCTIVSLTLVFSIAACGGDSSTTETTTETVTESTAETSTDSVATDTTMDDIQKWYETTMPAASKALIEYATANGFTNLNITDSKFRFGEDSGWYDCHYTFYFDCKTNGDKCFGEARGFVEYQSNDIYWFHFEVTRDADWATVVEHYDDAYDAIIEDYYKELANIYN